MSRILHLEHTAFHGLLLFGKQPWATAVVSSVVRARADIGNLLYSSRFCPTPASPSRLISRLLTRGSVFIDAGAHSGEMTMLASRCVGRTGAVHAFEPVPQTYEQNRLMVTVGGLKNVRLNETLLGERTGTMTIYQHEHAASSSVAEDWTGSAGLVPVECPVTTLDEYWKSLPSPAVDLIKIDVEGYEFSVLRGSEALLRSEHPQLILEIADPAARLRSFGYTIDEMMAYLERLGYSFHVPRGFHLETVKGAGELIASDMDLFCINEAGRLGGRAARLVAEGGAR